MPSRLSALDASFLFMEDQTTLMHAGDVAVFRPVPGFDHEQLVALVRQRIPFVPRYRQKVREIPLGLARPVWVDDENFDVRYHVRRSVLPKPGTRDQLNELVARLMSRPLDRARPLWEMYFVEGLADGSIAIISKSHQALVDGLTAVDIAQVLLDTTPVDEVFGGGDTWRPRPEPSDIELLSEAATELITRPAAAIEALREHAGGASRLASDVGARAVGVLTAAIAMARPPGQTPLNVEISANRRFETVDLDLGEIKRIRRELGGTVNDVLLAIITGALRSWLMARAVPVSQGDKLKALLPVSVAVPSGSGDASGSRVTATVVELPIGEPDPSVRVQHIAYQLAQLEDRSQFVGADSIINIAGFAPPTLHALGARVGSTLSSKVYNLVITNVPGPQVPLFAGGARLLSAYPVVPLTKQQALSIGAISYDGGVYLGLFGDRDALPDLDLLVSCIDDAREEMLTRADGHDH